MCGRIEVKKKEDIDLAVYHAFKVRFDAIQNSDLRPTQLASCLHFSHGQLSQVNSRWGIKPSWAKKPLINAQSESVKTKKTFSAAYALNRCVVPCSGWFEWTGDRGNKTKHRFSHADDITMYMAGILFPDEQQNYALVTLTREASVQCCQYHHRMPYLIEPEKVVNWLTLPPDDLESFSDSDSFSLLVS